MGNTSADELTLASGYPLTREEAEKVAAARASNAAFHAAYAKMSAAQGKACVDAQLARWKAQTEPTPEGEPEHDAQLALEHDRRAAARREEDRLRRARMRALLGLDGRTRAPRAAARPRGAGRPACKGAARRSSARSGSSGGDDPGGDPDPERAGPAASLRRDRLHEVAPASRGWGR